ncbi:type II toxin-antitoxin system RelE/ParE family toxin [Gramella sp. GC03-9]|uniref:Type II toxin-antitoxin system RelE/ParE family toxin n=1 Tax=Christiangramia oceanisediminis TaxID=2920386 RepID=A0A9X2KVQ8_9FLAO|nr:type II toxin-antitoxin system RelE/ParE family toxin [Gramella oceanisediminis]MCP9199437.1 type II toxin-antitoxin system RelE/ParE family toxin [Gramella oceanisediminis]
MVQVNWTIQARDDLKTIYNYIARDSKKYAQLQVLRLKSRTHILKTQAFSGKIVPELERNDIRELIEGSYRIIYKVINENRVDILSVHHSARDLSLRRV